MGSGTQPERGVLVGHEDEGVADDAVVPAEDAFHVGIDMSIPTDERFPY